MTNILFCAEKLDKHNQLCEVIARAIHIPHDREPYPVCVAHMRRPLASLGTEALDRAVTQHEKDSQHE